MPDHDRPLKGRGERDAPQMGYLLLDAGLVPQLILSSTAKRARKTAEYVAAACGYDHEIVLEHALYQARPERHLHILRKIDDAYARVLLVGHNPGLEVLLEVLTGRSEWLPTAALAHIVLPITTWADVVPAADGELVDLWTPKTLPQPRDPASG
jgi:phosphohistidine phosphatase